MAEDTVYRQNNLRAHTLYRLPILVFMLVLTSLQWHVDYHPKPVSEALSREHNFSNKALAEVAVTELMLINADNHQPIRAIQNGEVINLANLPTSNLAILAKTVPEQVGSVAFVLGDVLKIENYSPYALAGDSNNGEQYNAWEYTLNEWYQLTAIPYTEQEMAGDEGHALHISFMLVDNRSYNEATDIPTSFAVFDTQDITPPMTPGTLHVTTNSESQAILTWEVDWWQLSLTDTVPQLVWFYNPPREGDCEALIKHYDYFVLTQQTQRVETLPDCLRAAGQTDIVQYMRMDAVQDPCRQALLPAGSVCSCDQYNWSNNVAWNPDDICMLRDEHPDWFLRTSEGSIIYEGHDYGSPFVYMDPGNREWQEFWLERTILSQQTYGWHGVFLDNLEGGLEKHHDYSLANYPDVGSFQQAWISFLQYINASYFEPQNVPLLANIVSRPSWDIWHTYMPYLDGAMEESWAVDWNNGYYSPEFWESSLSSIEQTSASGKRSLLVSQGARDDLYRQGFAFASYLLISSEEVTFRYTYSATGGYHQVWLYDNYEIQLGQPLGTRYQVEDMWRRDFVNGSVWVNPRNQTWDIVVGQEMIPSLQLEVSTDNGTTFDILDIFTLVDTVYNHENLLPESSYCYQLRLVTVTSSRPFSNLVCIDNVSGHSIEQMDS